MDVPAHLLFLLLIKDNILGTPFFEKYVKTLNIENMSLTFNTPHESRVNTLPFTAHKK